jgi:hypothetical protein
MMNVKHLTMMEPEPIVRTREFRQQLNLNFKNNSNSTVGLHVCNIHANNDGGLVLPSVQQL